MLEKKGLIRPSAKFAFAGKEPGSTERKTGVNTPVNEDLRPALTPLFSAQVNFPRGSIQVYQGEGNPYYPLLF
jgi:hypothetical protein